MIVAAEREVPLQGHVVVLGRVALALGEEGDGELERDQAKAI